MQTGERRALTAECERAIRLIMGGMRRSTCPDWLHLDLSMGQLKAMTMLVARGPQSVGGLARALGIAEPSASQLADKLEEEGLAHRVEDPADRRRKLLTPSSAGIELFERLQQLRGEEVATLLSALTDDELAALARGLAGIARVAQARDTDAHDGQARDGQAHEARGREAQTARPWGAPA
jgi:DNA-binding MarR family transcriptional regulator